MRYKAAKTNSFMNEDNDQEYLITFATNRSADAIIFNNIEGVYKSYGSGWETLGTNNNKSLIWVGGSKKSGYKFVMREDHPYFNCDILKRKMYQLGQDEDWSIRNKIYDVLFAELTTIENTPR